MAYNWLYTQWNDNEYILFLVIIILTFIILDFGLWTHKKDSFNNITLPLTTTSQTTQPLTTTLEPTQTIQPLLTTTLETAQTIQPLLTTTAQTIQPLLTTNAQTIQPLLTTNAQTMQSLTTTTAQTMRPLITTTAQTMQPLTTTTAQTMRPLTTTTTTAQTMQPLTTTTTTAQTMRPLTTTTAQTMQPLTTTTAQTMQTNRNNLFETDQEKASWKRAWIQLDGNEETLTNTNTNTNIKNDITQLDSTLYNNQSSNGNGVYYNIPNNYATIDDLGKSLTDSLGGIKSNLGYTLLQEQLGTFKPNYNNSNVYDNTQSYKTGMNPNTNYNNSNVYDNTQSYKTGMNPNTVDGVASSTNGKGKNYQLIGKNGIPIIMQKDFAGVANIFAPNIYISNPPLNSDGYPDISYTT